MTDTKRGRCLTTRMEASKHGITRRTSPFTFSHGERRGRTDIRHVNGGLSPAARDRCGVDKGAGVLFCFPRPPPTHQCRPAPGHSLDPPHQPAIRAASNHKARTTRLGLGLLCSVIFQCPNPEPPLDGARGLGCLYGSRSRRADWEGVRIETPTY